MLALSLHSEAEAPPSSRRSRTPRTGRSRLRRQHSTARGSSESQRQSSNPRYMYSGYAGAVTALDAHYIQRGPEYDRLAGHRPVCSPALANVLHCGPGWTTGGGAGGSVCTATYPVGSAVVLTAQGGAFGGWSSNCTPVTDPTGLTTYAGPFRMQHGPNYCMVSLTSDDTVGGIFN